MKIAIPVLTNDENAVMYDRFGRSAKFAIYDTDEEVFKFIENPATDARGGAGIQAVQFLATHNIDAVIAPQLGPNADNALKNANIEIYIGKPLPVKELVELLKKDSLEKI